MDKRNSEKCSIRNIGGIYKGSEEGEYEGVLKIERTIPEQFNSLEEENRYLRRELEMVSGENERLLEVFRAILNIEEPVFRIDDLTRGEDVCYVWKKGWRAVSADVSEITRDFHEEFKNG